MRLISIILFFLVVNTFSYSQSKMNSSSNGNVDVDELPAVVIKSAGKDFSVYLPDRNPDSSVRKLQDNFIAYDLGKDYEGYELYLVTMQLEKGSLAATYNENGKLISVVEVYKNVKLPSAVIYSVYKAFPGWEIINDKFLYTQEDGDVTKKEYTLKIKKDKETKKLVVNPNGEILKS
ncbi:hypothetical protein [Flavobacterium humi]|uniref:Nicotinate-nucleotide adenylyltransferase n=1 Tax=Flavobacterium humi TaxID=2562683 RepID=A0A4Z0L8A8_9FLAO|nr:hypothetical protein [Flavobacterium humi]TGD58222.1 hypothetical protein E4635_09455 [Flavobacterium humi]